MLNGRTQIRDTLVDESAHMWRLGNKTLALTFLYYYYNGW
jgi:hypothetical protein